MSDDLVRVELTDIARTELAQRAELVLPRLVVDAGPVAVARSFWSSSPRGSQTGARGRRTDGPWGSSLPGARRRGLALAAVSPLHVAAYIRTHPGSAPTVKQHLAAIRMLGDWLVVSQVIPVNPAAAVRGPTHVVHDGRDAGALAGRGAPAPRGDRHGHARRPARPGARLGDALQLRAGERGDRDAAARLLPAGAPGVAQAPREGRPRVTTSPAPTIGRPRRWTTTSRGPGSTRRRRRSFRASTPRGGG